MRDFRSILPVLLLALLTGCSTTPSTPTPDDLTLSGSFTVRQDNVMRLAAGVSGQGALIYQGWQYPFRFENAKVNIAGDSPVELVGTVYNLEKVEDFEGVYTLIDAKIKTGEGISKIWGKNANGVVLSMRTEGQDVAINVGATGLKVTLQQ